jgi:hypothetical protein
MEGEKESFGMGQQALVCCVGDAALLRWTDCCALLQGQVNRDADWQLGCWGSTGQKVKKLWGGVNPCKSGSKDFSPRTKRIRQGGSAWRAWPAAPIIHDFTQLRHPTWW